MIRRVLQRLGITLLSLLDRATLASLIEAGSARAVVEVRVPGGAIRLRASSSLLLARATRLLEKEPDTIAWIDSFGDDAVLWDIGANVGVYSLYAALRPRATIIAFEPSAANFHVLCDNLRLNETRNVAAYCIAFSSTTRLGTLNLSSAAMGAAVSQFGEPGDMSPYWEGGAVPATQGTIGYSIDEFVRAFQPPFPTHMKLDVDGLEPRILEGAKATLADRRLKSVMVELSLTDAAARDAVCGPLVAAGFVLQGEGAPQSTPVASAANGLFVRS